MNLSQDIFLLSEETEEYLRVLYRKTKITGSVQLNFLAAVLQVPAQEAAQTARQLHALGLVRYEPYGRIRLTAEGMAHSKHLLQKNAVPGQR